MNLSHRKYCLIHLEIVKILKNKILTLKSYLKKDIIMFESDFNVKFPFLYLLPFLSDLKSTIGCINDIFAGYLSVVKSAIKKPHIKISFPPPPTCFYSIFPLNVPPPLSVYYMVRKILVYLP